MSRTLSLLLFAISLAFTMTATTTTATTATLPSPFRSVSLDEKVELASCSVNDVEKANAMQLSAQLTEVLRTPFFRKFKVINEECKFWREDKTGMKKQSAKQTTTSFTSTSHFAPEATAAAADNSRGHDEESCAATSAAVGLAEPACSLTGTTDGNFLPPPTASATTTNYPFAASKPSSSSSSLSTPPPQHEFTWSPATSPLESTEMDCSDPSKPNFFVDLCDPLVESAKHAKWVDLLDNPERWTGYNGSKIWTAIHDENCILDNSKEQCFEERVLRKLLSGMHASISLHIAESWFPPSKKRGRVDWTANPAIYKKTFANNPERIMNVHFAFVVMLRALEKAKPVLYDHDYRLDPSLRREGDLKGEEAKRTQTLVRRLLDSNILTSCSGVFSAFDESLLFSDGENPSTAYALKTNFKGVFHNISSVLDCVTCQKCKLHGKVVLMGLGTALKILLTPETVLQEQNVLEPIEVVALINSIGKLSSAITAIDVLSRQSWEDDYFATSKILVQKKEKEEQEEQEERKKRSSGSGSGGSRTGSMSESDRGTVEKSIASLTNKIEEVLVLQEQQQAVNRNANVVDRFDYADVGLQVVEKLSRSSLVVLQEKEENVLVEHVLNQKSDVLLLLKHYQHDLPKLMKHLHRRNLLTMDAATLRTTAGNNNIDSSTTNQQQDQLRKERRKELRKSTVLAYGKDEFDVVVVGAGLAGLTTAVTLVDRGAKVLVVEKNGYSGGNSAYASSGLNAVSGGNDETNDENTDAKSVSNTHFTANGLDTLGTYTSDTLRSSGNSTSAKVLAPVLTGGSFEGLEWIRHRIGLQMNEKGQLGGHTYARTWRPLQGMAGAEIIHAINKITKEMVQKTSTSSKATVDFVGMGTEGMLEMAYKTKLTGVTTADDRNEVESIGVHQTIVHGATLLNLKTKETRTVTAKHVVIATGGYAADTSMNGVLAQHRPDLLGYSSTNGPFADGSGHVAAMDAGAAAIDMHHVQVHPTAFVGKHALPFQNIDAKKNKKSSTKSARKTLCAELLRGVGGLLLDRDGNRFVSELEKRNVVVEAMTKNAKRYVDRIQKQAASQIYNSDSTAASLLKEALSFAIVLNEESAKGAPSHVPHYTKKGLLTKLIGLEQVAKHLKVDIDMLKETFRSYVDDAAKSMDVFGKSDFANARGFDQDSWETGMYWVGFVTPALHYAMGGMQINVKGQSLRADGRYVVAEEHYCFGICLCVLCLLFIIVVVISQKDRYIICIPNKLTLHFISLQYIHLIRYKQCV